MVAVPRVSGATVAPTNVPSVRVTASDHGTRELAQGVTNLAGAISGVLDQQIQQADESMLMDFENGVIQERTRLLEDPNSGAVTRKGKDAIGVSRVVMPDFTKATDERITALPSRLQARARVFRDRHGQTLQQGLAKHELQEAERFHAQAADASLNLALDDAIGNRDNPDAMNEAIARGMVAATTEWNRMGYGAEHQQLLRRNLVSGMHRRIVEASLVDDPVGGMERLEQYRRYLSATDAAALDEKVQPVVRDEAATAAGMAAVHGGAIDGMPTVRTGEDHARDAASVQAVYEDIGKRHGFTTTSTTRTAERNREVNGVANSQHLEQHGTARDWSIQGKSPEQVRAFTADLRAAGYRVLVHDAGSGMHVHAELPKTQRQRGAPHAGPAQSKTEAIDRLRASPLASNAAALRQAEAVVAREWTLRETRRAEAERDIGQAIFQKVASAPPNTPPRDILTPDELVFLANNESTNAAINRYRDLVSAGTVVKDDPATIDSIYRLRATDPGAFARANLAQYGDKLSGKTFLELTNAQREANKPEKVEQWASEAELLRLAYNDLGLVGDGSAAGRGEFELAFRREVRAFVEQNKRQPSADETQGLINKLKQPFARRRWWGAEQSDRRAYQGPAEGYAVPTAARAQILADYRDAGVADPTEQEIIEAYLDMPGATL
ncbi:MAG: D-Ala-D-Ala carboxypeptidase family metallohydrolase [Luteimonas sp.]|nr:D-Ala-D-Ala carboxypeptidase family metallohydrolase [Luteimonas sp.]